jgi:hypothetical protein
MATSLLRTSRRAATSKRKTKTSSDPIAQMIAIRAGQVARGEYAAIGRIMQIHTPAGAIDFRLRGPAFGRLNDGTLDMLEAWPGPPVILRSTNDLCPACLTKCDECKRGKRICSYGNQLQTCGGSGKIKIGKKRTTCASCAGTGKVECRLCNATGKMSTGKLNGSLLRSAPNCPECEGYGCRLERELVDITPHISTNHDSVCLGPIRGLLIKPYGDGPNSYPVWWSGSADAQGHSLLMVMKKLDAGSRAALLGGILVEQKNSSATA